MDRVLPGENLPRARSFSNTGILQGNYGIIYRSDPGTVHDVQLYRTVKLMNPGKILDLMILNSINNVSRS